MNMGKYHCVDSSYSKNLGDSPGDSVFTVGLEMIDSHGRLFSLTKFLAASPVFAKHVNMR
jgi:hypothetical protein